MAWFYLLIAGLFEVAWAIGLSLTSYDMVSTPRFVGLENYRSLAADPLFWETLANTFVYIAGSTVLITAVGLALALAINTRVPGARQCMLAMRELSSQLRDMGEIKGDGPAFSQRDRTQFLNALEQAEQRALRG